MPKKTKLAVVGSRGITNYKFVAGCIALAMDKFNGFKNTKIDTIVSGGARGVDGLAARYADKHGLDKIEILPKWREHGKKAGFLRNIDIIQQADVVLAIWDGKSRGTLSSIELARTYNKPMIVITTEIDTA